MTDREIIKTLECCEANDCRKCPLSHIDVPTCISKACSKALDLIKRQQAEVESLKADRPKGKWEKYGYKWKCSACNSKVNIDGTPFDNNLYYCSCCGAEMVGEEYADSN